MVTLTATLTSCLLLLLASSCCSGVPRKLSNPHLGQNQELHQTVKGQLFENAYDATFKYSSKYRPPSVNTEEPEATLVEIGIDSLSVLEFGETNQTIKVQFNFITEYKDSRLIYDAPAGLEFLEIDAYDVWKPEIRFTKGDFSQQYIPLSNRVTNEAFVTPDGRIVFMNPLVGTLQTSENTDQDKDFRTQIVGAVLDINDMEFAWKKQEPVTITDKVIKGEKNTYQLQPIVGNCKHTKVYGSLGAREFGCIELGLKVVKVSA